MLDRTATAWLRRLLTWLERFEDRFGRQSQRGALRRYVTGLLSDSSRKSMEAMWARLSDPGTYQAFQHFITDAPWDAEAIWKQLREVVPDRTGVLILDGTSFPKQGPASVGVARQVLWRARQDRELPDGGHGRTVDRATGVAAGRAPVPARGVAHAHPARAGAHSRDGRARPQVAAGADLAAPSPLGADHRHRGGGRRRVWRQRHAAAYAAPGAAPYALGVSSDSRSFSARRPARAPPPMAAADPHAPEPRHRHRDGRSPRVGRRPAPGRVAPRVVAQCTNRGGALLRGAHDAGARLARAPAGAQVWLLGERELGDIPRTKYYLVDLPAATPLKALVHSRISAGRSSSYQELKDELGLDHFEGRTLPAGTATSC